MGSKTRQLRKKERERTEGRYVPFFDRNGNFSKQFMSWADEMLKRSSSSRKKKEA